MPPLSSATPPPVTPSQFQSALDAFSKADAIEKSAKTMRENARRVILDYFKVNADEFAPDGDDGKVFTYKQKDGPGVSIAWPVKKGEPAHFDDERAVECYYEIFDTLGELFADELFAKVPKFVGPEQVIRTAKAHPDYAGRIADILLKYTVPTTQDEPMSPRVSAAK